VNNFRLFYFIGAAVVSFLLFMSFGVAGESGIFTYYVVSFLTFPIGLAVGYLFGYLSGVFDPNLIGLLYLPTAAVANYFQWKFIWSLYQKWKSKKQTT
jgi:hypothetical protein